MVDHILDLLWVELKGEETVQEAEGRRRTPRISAHPWLHVVDVFIDFVNDVRPIVYSRACLSVIVRSQDVLTKNIFQVISSR
jgi:hypothetical protein